MNIGIDIRVLGNTYKSGVEEYTEQLLSHLLRLDSSIKYKLFFSSWKRQLPDFTWTHLPNVQVKQVKIPNRTFFYSGRLMNVPKLDVVLEGVDVFFSPHFFLAPLSHGVRRVTTFHDLSFERFPEFFSFRKRIWHRFEMRPKWQARSSDAIIAVSDSTKNDLVELYNIDPAKIHVIYSGIAQSIQRPGKEELEEFRNKKQIPEKYILSVGTLEPRKNIIGLICAFELLKRNSEFDDLHLYIMGSQGWLYRDIKKAIQNSKYKSHITFLGSVCDSERTFYYSLASVFVYPSFFEGFGFPPLEAMTCKVPVIVSYNSSLSEVVKDAGLLIDPYNVTEIARTIEKVLKDKKLYSMLVRRGEQHVMQFSWNECAQKTLKLLTKI